MFVRAAARVLALLLVAAGAAFAAPAVAQAQGTPSSSSRSRSTSSTGSTAPSTGTFLGGVPSGTATSGSLTITVIDAIVRALDHNLGVLAAEEALGRARGSRWLALAELLPDVSGRVSETREKINLAAFGFGGAGGPSFPGIPTIVGPFNVFDARVFVSQSLFDLGARNDARSEAHLVEAARLTHRSARDFVIHVAGNAYIQALASSARADAARAQFETADTLYTQAVDLKQGGLVAGIDVLRAQVQRSALQQRATVAVNDFEKVKLGLARIMGLPLGQAFTLDQNLPDLPQPDMTLDQAVDLATRARPDYQAALERVKAAEAVRASVTGSNLPSAHVSADAGEIGLSAGDARGTFTLVGSVSVPIFNGGRTRGRLLQADADLRDRRAEAEDLRASIYYEIRTAYLDLQATSEQLRVATSSRDLAAEQLAQARDRFRAGVASNIEVVQAQEAVALATEQFISAQYGLSLAKGALVRGVGSSQDALRQIIGGTR
jgi:outer membrane protein TolC